MFNRSCRRTRPAARFTPRLEALDGRVLPGGAYGGVLGDRTLAAASRVVVDVQSGEEIPQTGSAARATAAVHDVWGAGPAPQGGHVDTFGCRLGLGGEV